MKKLFVFLDNFLYRVIIRNFLKLSKLGYGFVVTGAESGANFEHLYNNRPEGKFIVGRYIDKALLNLPAAHATRGRKEDLKNVLWNEIHNNELTGKKTRVLDLASGGARYLRELSEEHKSGMAESICIDRDRKCVLLGRSLVKAEGVENIKFFRGDIFKLKHLQEFGSKITWQPNVIVASGLFIYFNNPAVENMLKEVIDFLPSGGLVVFSSYENLDTKKLMRKAMSTSSGQQWTLYYRKPEYWRKLLYDIGFQSVSITRDRWQMNNICSARK